jgi:hypothetical protein
LTYALPVPLYCFEREHRICAMLAAAAGQRQVARS